jgi:putative PIN family toxin of toxin-antitoxin system
VIRAVLDTNLIVSAFFWGGLPLEALKQARMRKFQLVTSEELISELRVVISRTKFEARIKELNTTVELLIEQGYRVLAETVEPAEINLIVTADPDDNKLIACAVSGNANYLVSGDSHLLNLAQYQSIEICTVSYFLEKIAKDA